MQGIICTSTLWKKEKYIITEKNFRQINYLVISSIVTFTNFVPKKCESESLLKLHIVCLFDRNFLQNRFADFDETLHVAQACPGEGFGTIGMSMYPLV